MLWALISSAFVVYLYRKQNAVDVSVTSGSRGGVAGLQSELEVLEEKVQALEGKTK